MKALKLKCNGQENPIGVNGNEICFQWQASCPHNGSAQSAWRIQVFQGVELVWDSFRREGENGIGIRYEGSPLAENTTYEWSVKLWNELGEEGDFSPRARFETGLSEKGWKAKWIGVDERMEMPFRKEDPFYCADDFEKGKNQYYLPPAPYLRKEVYLKKGVKRARAYVSAFGLTELFINGQEAGREAFLPGLTYYPKRVSCRVFPVEESLREGANVLALILADGWYAGYMGLNNREWYGSRPRAILQLEVEYLDGSTETICTDESWKASFGKIREADIFQGETWDMACEPSGWLEAGYQDEDWQQVDVGAEFGLVPEPSVGVPIVEHEHVFPGKIRKLSEQVFQIQFYQYICGTIKIQVRGEKGSQFTVSYSETLGKDGRLWLKGNRSARCRDTYCLGGQGEECFFPRFTYHGFRYAEITVTGRVEFLSIEGVQFGSRISEPTAFHCNRWEVNRVFDMVRATEKANLFDVPTDCCARDERLGWGMEGDHFLAAMTYLDNQEAKIEKWLKDIFDGQNEDGGLEAVAPPVVMKDIEQFIGDLQSNHGIRMVYTIYRMYGRLDLVKKYYPLLEKYFQFLKQNSDRYLRVATSADWLGIWESTGRSDMGHGYGDCIPTIIGTAHYKIVVDMMAELSKALGLTEQGERYDELAENVSIAFQKNYIQRDGTLRQGKQAEYLLALAAGFFHGEAEKQAVAILEEKLTEKGYVRWLGGTPATPYFLSSLKKYGKEGLANQFLVSERYPSIGYMGKKGFDTIWERWDAVDEEGNIHPQVMNAICHEGLAVVGAYLVEGLAGIEALKPGFQKIRIAPGFSREITECSVRYQSPYGEILSSWKWKEGECSLYVRIPANTSARIELPCKEGTAPKMVKGKPLAMKVENKKAFFEVSSGWYEIQTEAAL